MKYLMMVLILLMIPTKLQTKDLDNDLIKPTSEVKEEKRETKGFVWEKPSQRLIDLIKEHEGLKLKAYICPAGKNTIGYGHRTNTLKVISKKEAYALLLKDLNKIDKVLKGLVIKTLSESKYEALLSFCYNVGTYKFKNSTLRKLINENPNNPDIRLEFAKWRKGGGKVLNGLVKRRKSEASMYFGGNIINKCLIK